MRIIIDTDLQAIIVPDSYYAQVDRLNEIITEAGGRPLEYMAYIRQCFDKSFETRVICKRELPELRSSRRKSEDLQEKIDK